MKVDLAPEPATAEDWFRLGLIHKRARRWEESRACNERAVALGADTPAYWNLGIAATALGDWARARAAWKGAGIPIPGGTGPIEMKLGPIPIRLDADKEHPEVVWSRRIDPARAILESVPLPSSGRRFGDLILHDGEPKGYREIDHRQVPVFDELGLLQASTLSTFSVRIEAPSEQAVETLGKRCRARGMSLEDWTSSIRRICKACSEGTPHEHGATVSSDPWVRTRELGIAARSVDDVSTVVRKWTDATPRCACRSVALALPGGSRH